MEDIDGMSYFNDKKFKSLIEKPKNIEPILEKDMCLISGDFYGIQKFIFDRLSTKNASKVLRAKSAFIQIYTEYLARYICYKLEIDKSHILSMNAGKFEILAPKDNIELKEIQDIIDKYFLKNFYGLSGVMLSKVSCSEDDFKPKENYKKLRKKIINGVEDKKFQKFNLKNSPNLLEYDTDIDNKTLCRICNIRKLDENLDDRCETCNTFVVLGEKLVSNKRSVTAKELNINLDERDFEILLTSNIKSYVLRAGDSFATFETLAENSCKESETGIEALAILKADVDNMGKFLEKSSVTDSFENFDKFSKTMDNFFSIYIPQMMKEQYPDTYTVFAGGDDLFLLGAWDEILELARIIREEFKVFVKDDTLSISFGIAIAKPTTPISYLAEHTERLLEEAKDIDDGKEVENPKDAISLFGETVKWSKYLSVYSELYGQLEAFEKNLNTAFLYRLLELIEMSKKVKYDDDIPSTIWKSKFRYSFNRNVLARVNSTQDKQQAEVLLKLLSKLIDREPKATKMVVNEFIYKRRES